MIFNISDEDFLDKTKVKIIDGKAGAGKSSKIDAYLKEKNIPYARYTSTNALKRDAQKRYEGTECDTIAGGLFTTEDGHFYCEMKSPDVHTVVIDEILQTSERVIDWIKENRGIYNIIVTTDTRQMLAK